MKILMTMFGWNDVGGGTSYPRQIAVDLVNEGHEVLVFYAAVHEHFGPHKPEQHRLIYHQEDGVQLVGVQDRPSLFLGIRSPDDEVKDRKIVESFNTVFEAFQPDVVHYHNFLGLSLGLIDIVYQAGTPSIFSAHNFWMICPTLYLWLPQGGRCQGINNTGTNCQACSQNYADPWYPQLPSAERYLSRNQSLLKQFTQKVNYGLVNSKCVWELFIQNGYDKKQIRIQKLSNPRSERIWHQIGKFRSSESPKTLRIGYIGQVLPIKGVHILISAAQLLKGSFEIHIHGVSDPQYLTYLKSLDPHQQVTFHGAFTAEEQLEFLNTLDLGVVTSIWFEHSALVITELLGARIPVIGANVGGIPDYLQADSCLTYPAENHQALASHLQDLIDNPLKLKKMKEKITPPESPRVYLKAILDYYREMLIASQDTASSLYQQRIYRFLKKRTQSQMCHAKSFKKSAGKQPYGLDIHQPSELEVWGKKLDSAQWITSPSSEVHKILEQKQLNPTFLPLLRPDQNRTTEKNYVSAQKNSILIFLTPDSSWKKVLFDCIKQDWATEISWIFLPWEIDFQTGQDQLVTYLDQQEPDLDLDMELLELNDEQEIADFIATVDSLILPKTHSLKLRYLALEARHVLFFDGSDCLQGLFIETSSNERLDSYAKSIHATIFQPTYPTAKAHNQSVFETLNKILVNS